MRSERVVFGRPIGQNQGVQFPIARAYAEWKAADLMTRAAAALFDAGKPCGEEANIAKLLASEAAWHAGEACMQTFGGFAAAREYDIERKWRECRAVADRADLDQSDPRLYRPARARHAALVLAFIFANLDCGNKLVCIRLNRPVETSTPNADFGEFVVEWYPIVDTLSLHFLHRICLRCSFG